MRDAGPVPFACLFILMFFRPIHQTPIHSPYRPFLRLYSSYRHPLEYLACDLLTLCNVACSIFSAAIRALVLSTYICFTNNILYRDQRTCKTPKLGSPSRLLSRWLWEATVVVPRVVLF